MNYKILITPEAELDLEDAYNWYKQQMIGLGSEFIRVVDASFSTIQRNPFACPIVHEQIRKKLIRKFPYGLFYIIINEIISIIGCFYVKRDPQQWERRL
ncbi:type II toxin-antitoxin system RelE/ParE family toxin [Nodularia sp. NIES-3585]|uniref:type II toxin-antitoxin system RelE/ParE family toxin n=1 Tax=Nodularia sp. NIES-3585 TaxID=1973477 RepID=UPI000B5C8588|nr:type II toxin-antitoxin system RelE/ParE family toxin [Nodularia sp. NIES-3585]GAX34353.1 plasmid stabilization system protein [Nodularia sp. NIES-3585]